MPRRRTEVVVQKESDLITVHRKRRAPLPTNETPREKTLRLLEPRVGRLLNEGRKVTQILNNPRVYKPLPSDLDRIEEVLDQMVSEIRNAGELIRRKPVERNRPQQVIFRLQA